MKQMDFGFFGDYRKAFGGSLLLGKRKSVRPLSTKNPLHLVLKSSGSSCFVPGSFIIEKLIRKQAEKYQIKIQRISLSWSHAHMILLLPSRAAYKAFIRTVTANLMRYFSLKLKKNLKGLFDLRPFTRILSWGRDLEGVFEYHDLNDMEARGMYSRKEKKKVRKKRS